jgi:uncharacterized membrane protein YqjE
MATEHGSAHVSSLLHSCKAYVATWVELLKTRLDLFSTELQEERERLQQILFLAVTAVLCLTFGALLVTLLIVAAFWETNYRLVVLGGLALLYLVAGVVVGLITRHKSRNRPKLLSATISELAKDYQHLSS